MNRGELAFIRDILLQKCNKMYLGQTHHTKSCGMNVVMFMQIGNSIQRKKGSVANLGQITAGRNTFIFVLISFLKMSYDTWYKMTKDTCMNF